MKKPFPLLSQVKLFDAFNKNIHRDKVFNPNNFNPLKYKLSFYSRNGATYKVDNTNYYIIIKSQYQ